MFLIRNYRRIVDVKLTFHMQRPNIKSKLVARYPSVMEQRYRRVLIYQNDDHCKSRNLNTNSTFIVYIHHLLCFRVRAAGSPLLQPRIFLVIRQIDRNAKMIMQYVSVLMQLFAQNIFVYSILI